jgi:hypothetical protein
MEYAIRFGQNNERVEVTTSGDADRAALTTLLEELAHDPRYSPGTPILIDHGAMDHTPLSATDLEGLGRFVGALDQFFADAKLAVVVPNAVAFGLSRMAQAHIHSRLRLEFFYSVDQAEVWLAE